MKSKIFVNEEGERLFNYENKNVENRLCTNTETLNRWAPAKPTIVFDTYWQFAAERQKIFFARFQNASFPWTKDLILQQHKFTNVYRASDRVSQYLIRKVIYEGIQNLEEVFFRIMLFKLFNKIETWELLIRELGLLSWSNYSFKRIDDILTKAMDSKKSIYSAAYMMPSGIRQLGYAKKHRNHLKLLERMMTDRLPIKLGKAKTMQEAFELLKAYPTIGDFLAYQFVTDINYSELTNFSEMEFVIPGPGARSGINKCFEDIGGLNEVELIVKVAKYQHHEFQCRGIDFPSLFGRHLRLIDCQNLFCEVDKYSRIVHPQFKGIGKRKRIKQVFRPKCEAIDYWFPPKWNINEVVEKSKVKSSIEIKN